MTEVAAGMEGLEEHGLAPAHERLDSGLLGIFEDEQADELLSQIQDLVDPEPPSHTYTTTHAAVLWGGASPVASPRAYTERERAHREPSASPSSSEWSESGGVPASSASPVGDVGEFVSEVARVEDKKRRNRDAARACRAKKKRNIQDLQTSHEELMNDFGELRKENETLKGINANLEKQLAFFQAMFKDTFQKSGTVLPFTEDGTPKGEGSTPTSPKGSGAALGLAFLVAAYNIQSHVVGAAPPVPAHYSGGGRGRALLSIEEEVDAGLGAWGAVRWMLLLALISFAIVRIVTHRAVAAAPTKGVRVQAPKARGGALGRGFRWLRRGGVLALVLPC
eukprot:CAMPEP_0206235180 /NCGR_PEP_ID=MMETSP0047_2-20121206/13008_1 /ASSEMBLY_ACC=CAM_ASM_000192 /TAXON_ID=195065 /ORGANISM="Chroomonas mesostigmatica_cf, Strain CCMP1168" /LENGTH=336 /DNA_ID=CAMNT_0053659359 /DNA_START=152 /DNA_END=1162 /DNA_ORIENTATION=-